MRSAALRLALASLLAAALGPGLPSAAQESSGGEVVAALSPDGSALAVSDPARNRTVIYRRSGADNLKKLWSVDRAFPEVFVWNGGGLVVGCFGPYVKAIDGSLAVFEIYGADQTVTSGTLSDIYEDVSVIDAQGSRYRWGECLGFSAEGDFLVVDLENYEVPFALDAPEVAVAEGPSADEVTAALDALEEEEAAGFIATVDYSRGVGELIKEVGFDEVDRNVNAANFPAQGGAAAEVTFDLVTLGRAATGEQAREALKKLGYRPATVAELLVFASEYSSEVINRNSIVALGSSWKPKGGATWIPYVEGKSLTRTRHLKLQDIRVTWVDVTSFLVVLEGS
jgi:hypothetical protein